MSSLEFRNTLKCSLNYKHLWHFQCSIDIQIIHYRIIIITTREYKFSFNCFAQIHGIFISPTYVIFFLEIEKCLICTYVNLKDVRNKLQNLL